MKTPVHLGRLSRGAACENCQQNDGPNDTQALQNLDGNEETPFNQQLTSDEPTVDYVVPNLRQSSRTHEVHVYYGFCLNPGEVISSEDGFLR